MYWLDIVGVTPRVTLALSGLNLLPPDFLWPPLTFGVKANNAERWPLVRPQWPSVDQTHTQMQRGGQNGLTSREAHSTNNAINQSIQETGEGVDALVLETCSVETGSPYRSVPRWSNILIRKLNFDWSKESAFSFFIVSGAKICALLNEKMHL